VDDGVLEVAIYYHFSAGKHLVFFKSFVSGAG
jgi:hypothetical protein